MWPVPPMTTVRMTAMLIDGAIDGCSGEEPGEGANRDGTVALSVQMIARREIFLCDTWSGPQSPRFATNAPLWTRSAAPFGVTSGEDLAAPMSRDGSMQQCRRG